MAVVLLSGGMDSATLLADTVRWEGADDVQAISFDYGQRHGGKELAAAGELADFYSVKHGTVNLVSLNRYLKGSALTDPTVKVPYGHYAEDNMKVTVVPNRNAVMLNIGVAIAIGKGHQTVLAAMHAGDHPVYPDCRPEFIDKLNELVPIATESDVKVVAPFIGMTKAEICAQGFELNVPFHLTWSCYEGGTVHCGSCGTCVERREAFDLAQVSDPTTYENEDTYRQLKEEGRVGQRTS